MSTSDDEGEDFVLSDEEVEAITVKVEFNTILAKVLDFYNIDTRPVDSDAHLIMRKLEFIFLEQGSYEQKEELSR